MKITWWPPNPYDLTNYVCGAFGFVGGFIVGVAL